MEPLPPPDRPVRSRARRLWFLVFAFSGLPALFSAMFLPFNPLVALPWVIVSWSIAGVSGYRIWRIDHPGESARSAVAVRLRLLGDGLRLLVAGAATTVVVSVVQEVDPVWLVVGVGVVVALAAVFVVVASLANAEPDVAARLALARLDEPSPELPAQLPDGEGGEGVATPPEPTVEPRPT